MDLPDHACGLVRIQLGSEQVAMEQAMLVRRGMTESGPQYGFRIDEPGATWRRCIQHLELRDMPKSEGQAHLADGESGELWTLDSLAAA